MWEQAFLIIISKADLNNLIYSYSQMDIVENTKTGNYNDDIRAYTGRCVSFWNHQTPASLLQNNNPVFSNTLMLRISLYILETFALEKEVKLFSDIFYCFCNPGKRI